MPGKENEEEKVKGKYFKTIQNTVNVNRHSQPAWKRSQDSAASTTTQAVARTSALYLKIITIPLKFTLFWRDFFYVKFFGIFKVLL